MGTEVANIHTDKEVDSITIDSNDLSVDSNKDASAESYVSVNGNSKPDIQTTNEGVKEFEVEKHVIDELEQTDEVRQVHIHEEDGTLNCETCLVKEKTTSDMQQTEGESKKSNTAVKLSTKSAAGHTKTKHTVPHPFALATEKRAQCGTRPVGILAAKPSHSSSSPAQVIKKTNELLSVARKPLQPDNKKHPDEDDACSVASLYP